MRIKKSGKWLTVILLFLIVGTFDLNWFYKWLRGQQVLIGLVGGFLTSFFLQKWSKKQDVKIETGFEFLEKLRVSNESMKKFAIEADMLRLYLGGSSTDYFYKLIKEGNYVLNINSSIGADEDYEKLLCYFRSRRFLLSDFEETIDNMGKLRSKARAMFMLVMKGISNNAKNIEEMDTEEIIVMLNCGLNEYKIYFELANKLFEDIQSKLLEPIF